jgi:hypothetical protein
MKCPLCSGIYDSIDKFCGGCYKRAEEAIDRRMGSITEHEQAVLVALNYLGFLYEGGKPLMVTSEAELACLAVTVAADVRRYRAKIADLEAELQQLRQPTTADLELERLISKSR